MKLLFSDASPYSRFVRVVIRQLAVRGIDEVRANPFDNSAELLDANPLGKIPCLILRDGSALFDSEVIARYLDVEYGECQLFGISEHNWSRQCQFSLIKGLIDSAVYLRQEQLREEEGVRSPFWTHRYEQALLRGLMFVERQALLAGKLSHKTLTAQQIGLVCLLDYIDFRHPDLDWRNVASATRLWFEEMRSLDVFVQTRPK